MGDKNTSTNVNVVDDDLEAIKASIRERLDGNPEVVYAEFKLTEEKERANLEVIGGDPNNILQAFEGGYVKLPLKEPTRIVEAGNKTTTKGVKSRNEGRDTDEDGLSNDSRENN